MSASHLIEMWERGHAEEPPALMASLLRDDERLLWVARLESAALSFHHVRLALFLAFFAALFMLWAPWRESLQDYCTPDRGRCTIVYYAIWPVVLFLAANALLEFWRFWRSRYSPTVVAYGVTTRRALSVDESRFWDARFVYLDLHPVQARPIGLGFQGSNAVQFIGLDVRASARATYWATEERRVVRAAEEAA